MSAQSLGRHLHSHLAGSVLPGPVEGLSPWQVVDRLVANVDALRDLAVRAAASHETANAVKARLAESRVLGVLLSLGVEGADQVDYARTAEALEGAVADAVFESPDLGDRLADRVRARGQVAYAAKLSGYAGKCRTLRSDQVSGNDRREVPA